MHIITIEFTLISVMVGVILFPLMDHAQALIRSQRYEYWLYVVSGILLILYLWTEVITHSLSIIGWPFEFGHNLIYIVFALTFAIQMNFLDDPLGWFAMSGGNVTIAAIIALYDYRMITRRYGSATGAGLQLLELATRRQRQLIATWLPTFIGGIASVALIVLLPDLFLNQHVHLILVAFQIGLVLTLILRTIRTFDSWVEIILQKAIDELAAEGEHV